MARLLLVDDERDIRHLFAAELEDEGYQVETAASVAEAETALGRAVCSCCSGWPASARPCR